MTGDERIARARRITETMANGNLTHGIDILFDEDNADELDVVRTALRLVVELKAAHPDKTIGQIVDMLDRLIDRRSS